MIEVDNLNKWYGTVHVVRNVTFSVAKGQTLALVGTSGSGKTTILKMINRLVEPTSGSIHINGQSTMHQSLPELRRQMGYVIQDTGLFPHYTIAENIGLVPSLLKKPADFIYKRTRHLMDRLSLDPDNFAHKYPHQLSGGQQQRAGIARALAADPPIILMDEPFGALDPITRKNIRTDFQNLDEWKTKTTILVTHDIEEAFELGDLICILDQGQIQQLGSPQALLFKPKNKFVRQFLADKHTTFRLKTTNLRDIYQHLSPRDMATPDLPVFSAHAPIQAILADFINHQISHAITEINGQWYEFDFNQIMLGLQNRNVS